MTTYRLTALTAEEIRSIGEKAVADVASLRITTTKAAKAGTAKEKRRAHRHAKGGKAMCQLASKVLSNASASGSHKSVAGSVFSQSEGRSFFKEAFNKARKG